MLKSYMYIKNAYFLFWIEENWPCQLNFSISGHCGENAGTIFESRMHNRIAVTINKKIFVLFFW